MTQLRAAAVLSFFSCLSSGMLRHSLSQAIIGIHTCRTETNSAHPLSVSRSKTHTYTHTHTHTHTLSRTTPGSLHYYRIKTLKNMHEREEKPAKAGSVEREIERERA